MTLKARLQRRIATEKKAAEAAYREADAQTDNVNRLETILTEGDAEHWRMALEAYK